MPRLRAIMHGTIETETTFDVPKLVAGIQRNYKRELVLRILVQDVPGLGIPKQAFRNGVGIPLSALGETRGHRRMRQ